MRRALGMTRKDILSGDTRSVGIFTNMNFPAL